MFIDQLLRILVDIIDPFFDPALHYSIHETGGNIVEIDGGCGVYDDLTVFDNMRNKKGLTFKLRFYAKNYQITSYWTDLCINERIEIWPSFL